MKKNNQVVPTLEAKRYERFRELEGEIEAYHAQGVTAATKYWLRIFEIYSDHLWDTAYKSQEEWIGTFSNEPFAPSRSQFFKVIDRYKALRQNGLTEEEVAFAIGTGKTAIIHDLDKVFIRKGKNYEIDPEIKKKLDDENTSVRDFVMEIAVTQSPSNARKQVGDKVGERHVYVHQSDWASEGVFLAKLIETGGDQDNRVYNVKVQFIGEEPPSELAKAYIQGSIEKSRF